MRGGSGASGCSRSHSEANRPASLAGLAQRSIHPVMPVLSVLPTRVSPLGGRSRDSRFGLGRSGTKPSVWGEWRELSESHSRRTHAHTPPLLSLSLNTPPWRRRSHPRLTPRAAWQGSPAPSPSAHSVASSAATSASYNPIHDALDEAALRKAAACTTLGDVLASHVLDRIFLGCVAPFPASPIYHALTPHALCQADRAL